MICRFKKNENGIAESILEWNWLLSAQSAEGGGRQYQVSHHQYADGDFVKKNCIIAKVKLTYVAKNKKTPAKKYNDSNEIYYDVKAQTSGRIFYLFNDGDEISENSAVAIIGDEADTREDVMKWYQQISK